MLFFSPHLDERNLLKYLSLGALRDITYPSTRYQIHFQSLHHYPFRLLLTHLLFFSENR